MAFRPAKWPYVVRLKMTPGFIFQEAGINMRRMTYKTCLFTMGALCAINLPGKIHAASKQQLLVDRAALAVQSIFVESAGHERAGRYLRSARAVMICPSLFRMSIVFGGSGGGCVLLHGTRRDRGLIRHFTRSVMHLSASSLALRAPR